MKAIMVMFDSLNRHMLPPYGCDWVHAPNFSRLATQTVTFTQSYVGSMPCMPARRELHTGRYNFLHRGWGPIEPFDDSMPEILKSNGIHTHLVSDHYHYWEEGGCNYHTRYNTWQISRGQEGDPWIGDLNEPAIPQPNPDRNSKTRPQDWVNRSYMQSEKDQPQAKTFQMGFDFIERNHKHDNWFLQIETFDPHEPYFVNEHYKKLYNYDYTRFQADWPPYRRAAENERELTQHYRFTNAALISMCDHWLGKCMDMMDQYDLWKDTMLIVNTDHGFLLGEHDWWGKTNGMPLYNEIAHTPLFIWDPRSGRKGEKRHSLVQTIDLPATLLEFFEIERPVDMQGVPLKETIATDKPMREAALFGYHGFPVNCTDGRYIYMRAPQNDDNRPLYQYTHMPTHMRHTFGVDEMQNIELQQPFAFTKGCPTMKIPGRAFRRVKAFRYGTLLFDLEKDPGQENPIQDPEIEKRMIGHMIRLMKENDAPVEQYERLGLNLS